MEAGARVLHHKLYNLLQVVSSTSLSHFFPTMSAEKLPPPAYGLTESDDDYATTKVKLQKAIDDMKESASSVESCFKNVADRLLEACEASSVFRPSITEFCYDWSACYDVCSSHSVNTDI